MKTWEDKINAMREYINAHPARSTWKKGVKAYAIELIDTLEEHIKEDDDETAALNSVQRLEKALLYGADSWEHYSTGACTYIFDEDIAKRLLPPSEYRRKDCGRLSPGFGKTWLDVQADALEEAAHLICRAYINTAA